MSSASVSASICEDEAMEWITDWDYERILPEHQDRQTHRHGRDHDDDIEDEMMVIEDEDMAPLPLDGNHEYKNDHEVSIFWTRVPHLQFQTGSDSEDDDDDDMNFQFVPHHGTNDLVMMSGNEQKQEHEHQPRFDHAQSHGWNQKDSSDHDDEDSDDEDDDHSSVIMAPLDDKEGLLPPMSPHQLYSAPGISTMNHDYHQHDHHETHEVSRASSDSPVSDRSSKSAKSDDIFERQQQLLQEVMQVQRHPLPPLPTPSQQSQQIHQELVRRNLTAHHVSSETASSSSSSLLGSPTRQSPKDRQTNDQEQDPIFARQQAIFQELRSSAQSLHSENMEAVMSSYGDNQKYMNTKPHLNPPPLTSSKCYNYPYYYNGSSTSCGSPGGAAASSSPVSVTKTLTRAGMDQEEYQKVVTRLTAKNLMERQRALLQQSMKRSLETRQALHIKPTSLENYDHDKLTQVLKDIERSTRQIRRTYY